jgi:hypothetical protein
MLVETIKVVLEYCWSKTTMIRQTETIEAASKMKNPPPTLAYWMPMMEVMDIQF